MVMVIHEHELAFEFVQDRRRLRHLKKRHCQLLNGTTLRCSEQRVARHMLSWDKLNDHGINDHGINELWYNCLFVGFFGSQLITRMRMRMRCTGNSLNSVRHRRVGFVVKNEQGKE